MPSGAEIPQYVLNPTYWKGHNLLRECGQEHPSKKLPPHVGLFKDLAIELALDRFAKPLLKEFMNTEPNQVIRTYAKGNVFDGHSFHSGTIVRYSKEHLFFWGLRNNELIYYPYMVLGVICQSRHWQPHERALITYNQSNITPRGVYSLGRVENCVIEIGNVDHDFADAYTGGSLGRVNNLQVLQMGKGMPAQETKLALRGVLGKLIPQLG